MNVSCLCFAFGFLSYFWLPFTLSYSSGTPGLNLWSASSPMVQYFRDHFLTSDKKCKPSEIVMAEVAEDESWKARTSKAINAWLNFKESIVVDQLAPWLDTLDKASSLNLKSLRDHGEARMVLAAALESQSQSRFASALKTLARLDPHYRPSETLFHGSLRDKFYEQKQAVLLNQSRINLEIASEPPAAALFVNGTFYGQSPLRLDALPEGDHHIHAQWDHSEGYVRWSPGQSKQASEKLVISPSVHPLPALNEAFFWYNTKPQSSFRVALIGEWNKHWHARWAVAQASPQHVMAKTQAKLLRKLEELWISSQCKN
jgi:hypothetical protein